MDGERAVDRVDVRDVVGRDHDATGARDVLEVDEPGAGAEPAEGIEEDGAEPDPEPAPLARHRVASRPRR
jgi:hypothetical protein